MHGSITSITRNSIQKISDSHLCIATGKVLINWRLGSSVTVRMTPHTGHSRFSGGRGCQGSGSCGIRRGHINDLHDQVVVRVNADVTSDLHTLAHNLLHSKVGDLQECKRSRCEQRRGEQFKIDGIFFKKGTINISTLRYLVRSFLQNQLLQHQTQAPAHLRFRSIQRCCGRQLPPTLPKVKAPKRSRK